MLSQSSSHGGEGSKAASWEWDETDGMDWDCVRETADSDCPGFRDASALEIFICFSLADLLGRPDRPDIPVEQVTPTLEHRWHGFEISVVLSSRRQRSLWDLQRSQADRRGSRSSRARWTLSRVFSLPSGGMMIKRSTKTALCQESRRCLFKVSG